MLCPQHQPHALVKDTDSLFTIKEVCKIVLEIGNHFIAIMEIDPDVETVKEKAALSMLCSDDDANF